MRRYLLYFSAAICAFGLGVVVAFNFFWTTEDLKPQSQEQNEIGGEIARTEKPSNIKAENERSRIICENPLLKPVWGK